LIFEIPGLPKLPNQFNRGGWKPRYGALKTWRKRVVKYAFAFRPIKPLEKARVTLTRYSSVEPDYDGLVGAMKPILDGLVDAGIIIDDKMSVIGQPIYRWEKCGRGQGKVRVVVESV
jgi:hypothetical protein